MSDSWKRSFPMQSFNMQEVILYNSCR